MILFRNCVYGGLLLILTTALISINAQAEDMPSHGPAPFADFDKDGNGFISEEEKKITAYHESGHTLVAKLLPDADPIHKVTIIPRGRALGLTQQLPVDEKHTYPKEYLLNIQSNPPRQARKEIQILGGKNPTFHLISTEEREAG